MFPQLFILGFLHILQPGHGQALLFSSLALENLTFKKILTFSLLFGVLHSLLLFIMAFFSYGLVQYYHDTFHHFEVFFAVLIMGLGIFLIYQYFAEHTQECNHVSKNPHNAYILYSILIASVIPCPSNMTFLLTNMTYHEVTQFWIGMIFYMLGIIISLFTLTSLVFIYGKNFIHKYFSHHSRIVHLLTGIMIFLMGVWILIEIMMGSHHS